MFNYNFNRVFIARGISKPFTYLCRSGFSDNFATKICNNRIRRLGLTEMEKLCFVLKCTPNDFVEWIPDSNTHNLEDHPMSCLRSNNSENLLKTINSIPVGQIAEIEEMIKEKLKKQKNI